MKYKKAIERLFKRKSIPRIIYVAGEELYFRDRALEIIKKRVEEREVVRIDGVEVRVSDVFDLMDEDIFSAGSKLVLVYNYEKIRGEKSELVKYIKEPAGRDILVFIKDGKVGNDKISATLKDYSFFIECEKLKTYKEDIPEFIKELCEERDFTITEKAKTLLLLCLGNNLCTIRNELEKLFFLKDEEKEIEYVDVLKTVTKISENSIFDLADSFGKKDLKTALKIVNNLYKDNPKAGADIIFALARRLKRLYIAKNLRIKGLGEGEVAAKLEMPPFLVKRLYSQLKNFSIEKIVKLMNKLCISDIRIKSGRIEPKSMIESFLIGALGG